MAGAQLGNPTLLPGCHPGLNLSHFIGLQGQRRWLPACNTPVNSMTSRRRFIYGMIAAQLASRIRAGGLPGNTGNNPTWLENQNAGTPNWQVGLPGDLRSDDFTLYTNR